MKFFYNLAAVALLTGILVFLPGSPAFATWYNRCHVCTHSHSYSFCSYFNCHHNDDDDNNNDIPLDGGLSFLAVAGAAYGVKRLRDKKRK